MYTATVVIRGILTEHQGAFFLLQATSCMLQATFLEACGLQLVAGNKKE